MYRTMIRTASDNKTYDISTVVSNVEYYTDITGQPGHLSFLINKDPNKVIKFEWKDGVPNVGDEVFFANGDTLIFNCFVFIVGTDSEGVMRVTAYDQMRYLNNEDTFVAPAGTASDLFNTICARAYIASDQYRVVTASRFQMPSKVQLMKSYYDIMEDAINDTLIGEGRAYYLIDRAGVLEFNLIGNDVSNVVIGEGSLLTGYRYEKDIDAGTYNKVVVVQGSEEAGYTKAAVVQDEASILKWGVLQAMLSAPEEYSDVQIQEYANTYLTVTNKPTTDLTLSAIGDDSIIAGTLFRFKLPSVGVEGRWMYAESCVHTYDADVHLMELTVKILPEDRYES